MELIMKEPIKKHLSFAPLHHDFSKKALKLRQELKKGTKRIPHKIVNFKKRIVLNAPPRHEHELFEHALHGAYSLKQTCMHVAHEVLEKSARLTKAIKAAKAELIKKKEKR